MILSPRWTTLRPHPEQSRLWNSKARFKVVPAGRRSGKTELAKRTLIIQALKPSPWDDARYFAAAPVRDQAKRIYWDDLKKMIPSIFLAGKPSESALTISLINGAQISVIGMDKPERIEGSPWDGGILDEYGNMKKQTWGANVRPALADRNGWCWLIGVPEGRNHYYQVANRAKADRSNIFGEWDYFHWKSADILPASEIEAAKRDLDELTYLQEYEGSFINFEGRAYYVFQDTLHIKSLKYNKKHDLAFCFDFNVSPGVAAVCQEQKLPNGIKGTGIISEVYIPQNSNTPAVCRKLIQDWKDHKGKVICYGDATGGARGSAKVEGSDWDLIKKELEPVFKDKLYFKVQKSNPSERARINAVNTRFKPQSGEVHMMVDPKATHVIEDFEGVRLLAGGSGELDKKQDAALTHISDAIGYYIYREFPVVKKIIKPFAPMG